MRKRLLAVSVFLVMIFTTLFGNVVVVSASSNNVMDGYAANIIGSYLHANGYWGEDCYLSQACPIYDILDEDISHYLYFVLKEGQVVGRLAVFENAGQYTTSYIHGAIDGFNPNNPFQLYLDGNSMFLRQNFVDIQISGEAQNENYMGEIPVLAQVLYENNEIEINQIVNRMTYYYLSVSRVSNSSVNGAGLCWAACIAARVNYHQGTSLTARNVYDACNATATGRPSGTPSGIPEWIQYGYSIYGINTTYVTSGRNFGQICNLLSNDTPIHCTFTNGTQVHGVLLIGVYQEGSSNIYMYRDPNESGVVSINVSNEALNDSTLVTYTNTVYSFDDWCRSFY